jgi:hypothetical protein
LVDDGSCPQDVVLLNDVHTQFPPDVLSPIRIVSQDNSEVTFQIVNPFGNEIQAMYYQYAASDTGATDCYSDSTFAVCEPETITAHCITGGGQGEHALKRSLTIVDVWFVDPNSVSPNDKWTIPECCKPAGEDATTNKVLYSFKVYCESHCPERRGRRAETIETLDKTTLALRAAVEEEGGVSIVMDDEHEQHSHHFCASEDFPCGDDGNVHICHYSAKDGYQTYCVPETDSDVATYFPKDYCGPCVGGYSLPYRN